MIVKRTFHAVIGQPAMHLQAWLIGAASDCDGNVHHVGLKLLKKRRLGLPETNSP